MATYTPDLHTQAGARWLAAFLVVFAVTVVAAFAMVLYPHV